MPQISSPTPATKQTCKYLSADRKSVIAANRPDKDERQQLGPPVSLPHISMLMTLFQVSIVKKRLAPTPTRDTCLSVNLLPWSCQRSPPICAVVQVGPVYSECGKSKIPAKSKSFADYSLFCCLKWKFTKIEVFSLGIVCSDWTCTCLWNLRPPWSVALPPLFPPFHWVEPHATDCMVCW